MMKREKKTALARSTGQVEIKAKGIRTENDLELLKIILDENMELKERVLAFMRKNYARVIPK